MDLVSFLHIILESGFTLFFILAAIYIRLYEAVSPKVTGIMTAGLLTSAVINIADAMTYVYDGNMSDTGYYMLRISNFAVFAGMFVLLALCIVLLDIVLEERGGGSDKRIRDASFLLCAAGVILTVVSALTGILYGFDGQNVYHRGPVFAVFPLLALLVIILMLLRTVRERQTLGKKAYRVFMCFWLLPAAGAVVQLPVREVSISNTANSLALLIMLAMFMREAAAAMSIRKSFILKAESIESISADLDRFLKSTGTERQNRIRIRFTVEEALMRIWGHFGDPSMVKVTAGIKFGRPSIRTEYEGEAFNPFSKTRSSYEDWSSGLLASAGLSPTYSYARGNNSIRISLSRISVNPVITVLLAIVFGLVAGSVALMTLSGSDAEFLTSELLVPVYDMWNNMLYSVAAPAMLIIVCSTMLDTREVSEQGGSSGLIVGRYLAVTLFTGGLTLASAAVLSSDGFASESLTREAAAELVKRLFGIIPENLLNPFRDFNTAQIILMGLVLAYAIMAVGHEADGIASLIHQFNMICTKLAQWIAGLMPLFTIFLTAQLVLEHNAGLLLGLLRILPFALVVSLVFMGLTLLYVSKKMSVDPGLIIRKLWPSFLLTLRTGQVADSYALAERCCRSDLGIQRIFTQRLFPLGLVLYMPVSMIGMVSFVIYAAIRSGISMTPVWMLTAIVFALILLVAAPPIPGINLLSYVVIMGQLGIGKEYVIAAMIFDIIFNMFASAANQMMLQMDLVLQADHVGLLNHEALQK